MPKRTDIKSILVIGAGPIVIGQACEFDYSGAQACKALKAEGYRIILVNSNPATIMTDPGLADATYVEPITPDIVARIIEKERPDALLPTMGGQTALNLAKALHDDGTLERLGVELVELEKAGSTLVLRTPRVLGYEAPYELVKTMRASFLAMGPLLARFGFARVATPGGCAIGTRPVNLHLEGLVAIDAEDQVDVARGRRDEAGHRGRRRPEQDLGDRGRAPGGTGRRRRIHAPGVPAREKFGEDPTGLPRVERSAQDHALAR